MIREIKQEFMRLLKFTAIIISYLLISCRVSAQNYNFKNLTIEDGLLDWETLTISQKSDGQILVGTLGGLSFFDGVEFYNITKLNGLLANSVIDIVELGKNSLLVATYPGLSLLKDGKILNFPLNKNKEENSVLCMYELSESKVFVGTTNGLYLFSNEQLTKSDFEILNGKKIYRIFRDNDTFYFSTSNGIFKLENSNWSRSLNGKVIYSIIKKGNDFWAASKSGLYNISAKDTIRYGTDTGLTTDVIYDISLDSNNDLWIATDLGLLNYHNGKFKVFTREQGLDSDLIYKVFVDKSNNLWIGTEHGISLLRDRNEVIYTRNHGVKTTTWSIIANDGSILIGSDGEGLLELKDSKFEQIHINDKVRSVWNIVKDKNGYLWFSTNDGIYFGKGKHFSKLHNKVLNNEILMMFHDSKGGKWFSTYYKGVYYLNGDSVKLYTPSNGLNHNTVYSMLEDSKGRIYLGSERGLNIIENGKIISFPGEKDLYNYNIIDIEADGNGGFILGTYEKGAAFFNYSIEQNSFQLNFIDEDNGLNNNSVMFLQKDSSGSLWIGTNSGLNKLNLQKYNIEKKIENVPFNTYDGILGIECNANSNFLDDEGNLWYGTSEGVVKLNCSSIADESYISKLMIEKININYSEYSSFEFGEPDPANLRIPKNLILPADSRQMKISFAGIDFDNPTSLEYSYMLEGQDKAFSPFRKSRTATFSNLTSGNYKFLLKCRNRYGNYHTRILEYSFIIQTPFYNALWFRVLIISLIFIITGYLYKKLVVDVRKRNAVLEKLYNERLEYEDKLNESQQDYQRLFEQVHEPILISDPENYEIIDANLYACNLYGYSKEELVEKTLEDIATDFSLTKQNINRIKRDFFAENLHIKHKKKTGDIIELQINAALINYRGKKCVVATHHDITVERQIQENLISAKNAAEKSNRLKSEFLAQISHEIRSPINVMLNFHSLIKDEVDEHLSEDLEFAFGAVNRAGNRIIRTIDLILNVSEIQTGTYDPKFSEIDLDSDILVPLISEYKLTADTKGIKLIYNVHGELQKINLDSYTITKVFENLIDNAIKYTEKGQIEIKVINDNTVIAVEIEDTGIGIEEEFLDRLFEPFSQEQQGYTRKFEGNGLGLSLVKGYCDLNGAGIFVESKKGQGTKFTVKFN